MAARHGNHLGGATVKRWIPLPLAAALAAVLLLHSSHADPAAGADANASALTRALAAYDRGEIATARAWTGLALDLLARDPERRAPGIWPGGNARQLLDVLDAYDFFARGRDAARDSTLDALGDELRRLEWLHAQRRRIDRGGEARIDYDLHTRLVRRIGDLHIDYDLWTRQITRLGAVHIDYDLHTRMPRRIAGVDIDYDLHDGGMRRIAGVWLR